MTFEMATKERRALEEQLGYARRDLERINNALAAGKVMTRTRRKMLCDALLENAISLYLLEPTTRG